MAGFAIAIEPVVLPPYHFGLVGALRHGDESLPLVDIPGIIESSPNHRPGISAP
jgi:hypothetical protein